MILLDSWRSVSEKLSRDAKNVQADESTDVSFLRGK